MPSLSITLIGGPTALIELDRFADVTDPTFDPPGDYPLPHVTSLASAPLAPARSASNPVLYETFHSFLLLLPIVAFPARHTLLCFVRRRKLPPPLAFSASAYIATKMTTPSTSR